MFNLTLFLALIILNNNEKVNAHGRLLDPIARTSLWRLNKQFAVNYQDNEMNCGGLYTRLKNDNKCGICGENEANVKLFEKGGHSYTNGYIVKTYEKEQQIQVKVEVSNLIFICPVELIYITTYNLHKDNS